MTKSMKRSRKTQKLWNMKGCSGHRRTLGGKRHKKKGCGCGLNFKFFGGNLACHKCPPGCRCGPKCNCGHNCPGKCYLLNKKQLNKKQKGGNCGTGMCQSGGCSSCLTGGVQLQNGGAANGALVGAPWTPKIDNWPGVGGLDGQTNYYSKNNYLVDPQTAMGSERNQITYTKQNGGTRHRKRGGGLIPQDLVNLGRSMVYGAGSAYNTLNGYATSPNPLPYKDQLTNTASSRL